MGPAQKALSSKFNYDFMQALFFSIFFCTFPPLFVNFLSHFFEKIGPSTFATWAFFLKSATGFSIYVLQPSYLHVSEEDFRMIVDVILQEVACDVAQKTHFRHGE